MKTAGRSGAGDGKNGTRFAPATIQELAAALGITRRGAQERAGREGWLSRDGAKGRGKIGQCGLEGLPRDIRDAVLAQRGTLPEELKGSVPEGEDSERMTECLKKWHRARPWQKRRALARKNLLDAVECFCQQFKGPEGDAIERFVRLFNDGQEIMEIDGGVRAEVKTISPRTVYGWRQKFKKELMAGLISGHGANRGKSRLSEKHKDFILGKMYLYPEMGPKPIWKGLVARFKDEAPGLWQVWSFMKQTRKRNPADWEYVRNPKGWKDKMQAAPGNASEKAQHFMHFGEMDSTPADVICSDGKRYTIIGFIDVYSRKVMFEVAPTSNQWAIRALLWRLWGTFGVPKVLTVDHGKDYQAKSLHDAFAVVGTKVSWIAPFTPESKGHIERMFHTLARSLFEILPGFCGHDVEQRQQIRERAKLLRRLGKRGEEIEIPLSREELQEKLDQWVEYVYHQETHTGKGMKMSPNAKASLSPKSRPIISDPKERTMLLAPNEERRVGKDGVHYNGGIYWADELGPLVGDTVRVHENMWDVSRVYCADLQTGDFICEAEDRARSGRRMTPVEARQAKKIQKQARDAFERSLKIKARMNYSDPLEDAILAAQYQGGTVHNLPAGRQLENPYRQWPKDGGIAGQTEDPENAVGEIEEEVFAEGEEYSESEGRPRLHLVGAAENEALEQRQYDSPIDGFEHLRAERKKRSLTQEETDWMEDHIDGFRSWVKAFWKPWPEDDQLWLCDFFPEIFAEKLFSFIGVERPLGREEQIWLRKNISRHRNYIRNYIRLFRNEMPEGGLRFLAQIAPDDFGEYAVNEAVGDSH